MIKKLSQKGFTLIELLVVVAIISLLSSVVLGALNDARAKARDRALLQTVVQIQNALELYRDKYGEYPDASSAVTHSNYYSIISSTGVWRPAAYASSPNRLIDKIQEFLPSIEPPKTGFIKYYNHITSGVNRSSWCSDQGAPNAGGLPGNLPPYTLSVTFEQTSFAQNFPKFIFLGTQASSESCFSLK